MATVFLGRSFDFVANRVADALLTLPSIFFAVAVTAALGNGLVQAMLPVGILLIPLFFRITRAAALQFTRAQYVEAAELLGGSKLYVIQVHVVRKVLPTIAVTTASRPVPRCCPSRSSPSSASASSRRPRPGAAYSPPISIT